MGRNYVSDLRALEPPVGRARELEKLRALLPGHRSQPTGRAVLVTGGPGVGKTRLIEEALRDSPPLTTITFPRARFAAAGFGLQKLASLPEAQGSALAKQLRRSQGVQRSWKTLSVYEATDALLRTRAPATLVLDDLQWADDLTLGWLSRCGDILHEYPVVLLLALRSEARVPPQVASALGEISRRGRLTRLNLRTLTPPEVRQLAEAAGLLLDGPTIARFHARTGGLPLALTEILDRAAAEEVPEVALRRLLESPASTIPAFVSLVHQEICGLERDSTLVLQILSLAPHVASLEVVRRAAGLPPTRFLSALERCLSTGLLQRKTDEVVFRHDLHREVVHDHTPAALRRSLHLMIAQDLARHPTGQEHLVAEHLLAAGQNKEATSWLELAADDASRRHDFGTALRHLTQAFESAGPALTDADIVVLEKLAIAARYSHRPHEGVEVIDDALRRRGAPQQKGRLLMCRARLCFDTGDLGDRSRTLMEARKAFFEGEDMAGRAIASGHLAVPSDAALPIAERIRFGLEGLRFAERAGSLRAIAICGGNLAAAKAKTGDEGAFSLWERTVDRIERDVTPELGGELFRNLANWAWNAVDYGRYSEAGKVIERALRHTETTLEDPAWRQSLLILDALRLWRLGRWDDAIARVSRTADFPQAEAAVLATLQFAVAFERGPANILVFEKAVRNLAGYSNSWEFFAASVLIMARGARREPRPARGSLRLVDRICKLGALTGWDDLLPALSLTDHTGYGAAMSKLGRITPSGARGEAAGGLAAGIALQRSGDHESAVDRLLAAAGAYESIGEPLYEARAYEAAGQSLSFGLVERVEMMVHAAEIYERLGARRSLNRLLRKGGRSRALARFKASSALVGRTDGLSPRQRTVAELCGQGLTAREIASTLGISARTTEKHIESIRHKLGVPRKSDLIRRLADP